jgi:transposase-like protein
MRRIRPSEEKKQVLMRLFNGSKSSTDLLGDILKLSVEKSIQELLELEQEEYLERAHYARDSSHSGLYRNGYEEAHMKTGQGVIDVRKPQIRGGSEPYRSQLWQRFDTTTESLRQLITEMYTLGLSTRDVEQALERSLGRFMLSRSSVSTITEELFNEYEAFKKRNLSGFDVAYVFIDTVYEPLRRYGSKSGVLCCWAYLTDGSKVLLDLTTAQSESFDACLDFLRGMSHRGLRVPFTVTTDGAPGLMAAVEAHWPQSVRIRCWFHKMQNLNGKIPREVWPEFKGMLIDMRDAPTIEKAQIRMATILEKYRHEFPEACRCLEDDSEALCNHIKVPERHRQYVRTTNLIERTFVEQRRRTKVTSHLWDEKSMIKMVFAVLWRVSERWAQPSFSTIEETMLKRLRNQILNENEDTQSKRVPRTKRSYARAA